MKTRPWRTSHIHQRTTIDAKHVNSASDGGGGSNYTATTTIGHQQQRVNGNGTHIASQ